MAGKEFGLSVILQLVDRLSAPLSRINTNIGKMQQAFNSNGAGLRSIGKSMSMYVTAPLVGLGVLAGKTAMDFETAFTGVVKTVNATGPELEALRVGFLKMAKEIPLSTEELYGIGEAAGQLGIKTDNILSFSKTMADLGATTNLAANEAATQLARFANITGMNQKEFQRLGSTIVALGNNSATTEAEIVAMGMRLAGAGHIVGLSESQIMSLAATMSSLGLEAEAGGTAFSRVMIEMNKAVAKGSKELGVYEAVAKKGGLTGTFKEAFKKDAIGSLQKFIEGMKALSDGGMNVSLILDQIGLDGIRTADSLLRAAGGGKLLNDTLKVGADAWRENTAMTREAELRYKTSASQLKMLWNEVKQLAASFGDILLPTVLKLVQGVKPLIEWLTKLSPATKQVIVVFAGLVALIGPLAALIGTMMGISAALAAIGVATAPILAVAGAITALSGVIAELVINWNALTSGGFVAMIKDFGKWIKYMAVGDAELDYANRTKEESAAARERGYMPPGMENAWKANKQSVDVNNKSEVVVKIEAPDSVRAKIKSARGVGTSTTGITSGYAGPMGVPLPAGS